MVERIAHLADVREGDALADVRHQAETGADRFEQPVGKRVRQRRDEGLAVVERRRQRRVARVADLVDRDAVRAEHVVEDAVAAAHRRLRRREPGESRARHDVPEVPLPRLARTTRVRIQQAAANGELRDRDLGDRIARVVGLRRRRDRQRRVEVEPADEPALCFGERLLRFPSGDRGSASGCCARASRRARRTRGRLLFSVYAAARLIVPPVGRPSRNEAKSWPNGAAAELSSGPRVQVLLKLICGDAAVEKRLASSM